MRRRERFTLSLSLSLCAQSFVSIIYKLNIYNLSYLSIISQHVQVALQLIIYISI